MSEHPSLTESIKAAMKAAMKAKEKERLATIRLIQAEFKRVEVDERIEVSDERALIILDKMVKQRRDSASQYHDAGRQELAAQEEREILVLQEFLPTPLTDNEISAMVDSAIADTGASGVQAMGSVMNALKLRLQGRADTGAVSKIVKQRLGALNQD
ncbi:MAG: GatB/YqeY domain-containing protein [Parahaliea sp.]